jgi:ABC-type transporter Mla subunit MlaD
MTRYTVTRMADNAPPGLGDLLGLFGNNNPFAGVSRSVAQFQRGVSEFLTTIENLNAALEQFNQVSVRVNTLLDLVEEPIKAFVPQVTRTVRAADELVERLSGPVDKVAPGLTSLAETLSNPALAALPKDLNEFLGVLRDLARRMQPLGQMAETAGGLFSRGPFASLLGGVTGTTRPEPSSASPTPPPPSRAPTVEPAPPVLAPTTAATVKQPRPKKAATRAPSKTAAKRAPAKKAAPRR